MSGMIQSRQYWGWQFSVRLLVIGGAIPFAANAPCFANGIASLHALSGNYTLAQITPDGTLGAESSVATPNVNIKGHSADRIGGGAIRGTNLFHSFSQFNVDNEQRVYFANPVGIENILTRVTGGNPSNIFGTLGVDGGANLFLLNPNGIIFGSNARLDIAGSFFASTEDSVVFDNGYQFSAKNPEAPPLLTISVRPGLQYGRNHPGATIANAGTLTVGQNLTLVADNIDLQGQLQAGENLTLQAQDTVKVRDSTANPFIASAGDQLLVQGNQGVDIFALNNPNSGFYANGDLVLRSANSVGGDAHYWAGGNFRIEKLDGSLGNLFSPNDPIIRASGDVNFDSYEGTSLHIFAGGSVNISGNVTITGADATNFINELVLLSDETTTVSINGSVQPTLDIRAGTTAFGTPGLSPANPFGFIPPNPALDSIPTSADITIGSININEPNGLVFLTNQYAYAPNPLLPGGVVKVTGEINTRSSLGNSGAVIIDSRSDIIFTNSGSVYSWTSSPSSSSTGGNITLIALKGTVSLENQNNVVFSGTGGAGRAGDIRIEAEKLIVQDGGVVSTIGTGSSAGQSGDLTVKTSDSVEVIGAPALGLESGLFSGNVGSGEGGNLRIETGRLIVRDGAQVAADNSPATGSRIVSNGSPGTVTVLARDSVEVIGAAPYLNGKPSGIFTFTINSSNAGDVHIETGRFIVRDGASVSTVTTGAGQAGNLVVRASELVEVSGTSPIDGRQSRVRAITDGAGNGGNLTITTGTLVVQDGGLLSADTLQTGRAGNLEVTATDSVQVIGSSSDGRNVSSLFFDSSGSGNAGDLTITTGKLLVQDGGRVSASTSGTGQAGKLAVKASDSVEVIGISRNGQTPSQLFFDTSGAGDAGELKIDTGQLTIQDGGKVSASTSSTGRGGIIEVNATNSVEVNGTSNNGQFASGLYFDSRGAGGARGISINTGRLEVQNGGEVTVSGTGSGSAGDLQITADSIFVNNQGTLQATNASGAGSIRINTGQLTVQNESQVTVSGSGSGVSGDLEVKADSIFLDNQGNLTARTNSGEGGNIRLQVGDTVWLRHQSNILTEATNIGNGGNITINAGGFVLAVLPENSDVAATAIQGRGGNIFVTAQGVFGFSLPERLVRTPESDISAASELGINGTREINTPANPRTDALPDNFLDDTIDTRCPAVGRREGRSSFVVTGRGGLPDSPESSLRSEAVEVGLVAPAPPTESRAESHSSSPTVSTNSPNAMPKRIVEAQGWVIDAEGRVVLVAQAPTLAPYSPWIPTTSCQTLEIQ